MYYVYLIQSINNSIQTYIGFTDNIQERMQTHNSGGSVYTSKDRPWKIVVCVQFEDKYKAKDFEKYLKSGSGRAFAKKRLW